MSQAHNIFLHKSIPEDPLLLEQENMVASLRNLPVRLSSAEHRPVHSLSESISNILNHFRLSERTPHEILMENWESILGNPGTAMLCQPQRIDNTRILWISVIDPVIRQELQFHRTRILKNIQKLPSCAMIRDLRFCQG